VLLVLVVIAEVFIAVVLALAVGELS